MDRRTPKIAGITEYRAPFTLHWAALRWAALPVLLLTPSQLPAQSPANAPASIPAGADAPAPVRATNPPAAPLPSAKALRAAEDAYLRGARALEHKDLPGAEHDFLQAATLNPRNGDYTLALAVTREHRLTELVQEAAAAQRGGRSAEAEGLLTQARSIDPENAVVRQHFQPDGRLLAFGDLEPPANDPVRAQRSADTLGMGGPVRLAPAAGVRSFHTRAAPQELLSTVCAAFGLKAQFDASVVAGQTIRLDLEDASYGDALRAVQSLTHTFAVPLQPKVAFFAKDTPENRAQFQPLVEETLFMPGVTAEALTEYANLARNVFDLRTVTAVGSSGGLVLRGDEDTIDRVNATFDDLLDGGADVLLDLTLYEVDTSHVRSLGVSTPTSAGVYSVAAEASSIVSANQSTLSAAVAAGAIKLTGNTITDEVNEVAFLVAAGLVTQPEFTNLLGTLGRFSGAPLAGVFLGSTTTFNAALNSSDVRILDTVQLRVGQGQEGSFRAGTRYPIETGIYSSSSAASSLPASIANLTINGTSVASLLGGAASVSVPQVQYEDLGLTLKATPGVLRSDDVTLKLDLKIEALGSGTVNTLPVLNNRQLTSQVTIPSGQTALLASLVSRSEQGSIDGLPFLSELPGFQGTEKSLNVAKTELLITLTPHVVRNHHMEIASRRLLLPHGTGQTGSAP